MAVTRPTDLYFTLHENGMAEPHGEFEVQLGLLGEVINVWIGGVKVTGAVDVNEFMEQLIGQGFLAQRSYQIQKERLEYGNGKDRTEDE